MTVIAAMPNDWSRNGRVPMSHAKPIRAGFWRADYVIVVLIILLAVSHAFWGWMAAGASERARASAIREQRLIMRAAADAGRRAIEAGSNYDVAGVLATMAVYIESNPTDLETASEFRKVLDEWITKGHGK